MEFFLREEAKIVDATIDILDTVRDYQSLGIPLRVDKKMEERMLKLLYQKTKRSLISRYRQRGLFERVLRENELLDFIDLVKTLPE